MPATTLQFTGERMVPGQVAVDLYQEHVARYIFAEGLAAGKSILDAGCGVGYGTAHLARTAAQVIGIDSSAEAVQFAEANHAGDGVTFLVADATDLPFEDDSFDVVVAFELIEHLEDPKALLREISRVLKADGHAIISTPNRRTYTDERPDYRNPFHVREFYDHEFRSMLEDFFPSTVLFCQNCLQAQTFAEPGVGREQLADWHIVSATWDPVKTEHSQYLVAVCNGGTDGAMLLRFSKPLVLSSVGDTISQMRLWIEKLREEVIERDRTIAERTEWAQRTVRDLEVRDELVRTLQRELKERTDWAQQNEREAAEAQSNVRALEAQLANLQPHS